MFKPDIGEIVHGYTLKEQIYQGGFGEIYLAEANEKTVAIKMLRSEMNQKEAIQQRFLREIRVLQQLHHENIVPILGFGYQAPYFYLVMPYIQGKDLHELLAEKRYTPLETQAFVTAITGALACGHQQQIIHRDLKPENILVEVVGEQFKYYLADFGLAKRPGVDATLTMRGTMLGTAEYMSPEYISDSKTIDQRTDIYSLTVLTYEMLLGVVPFDGKTPYQIIIAQTKQLPPPPSSLNRDFPPALEAFLLKNLEKDPDKRHNSVSEFAQAYTEIVQALTPEQQNTCYWVI